MQGWRQEVFPAVPLGVAKRTVVALGAQRWGQPRPELGCSLEDLSGRQGAVGLVLLWPVPLEEPKPYEAGDDPWHIGDLWEDMAGEWMYPSPCGAGGGLLAPSQLIN